MSICASPFVGKTTVFPLDCLGTLVKINVNIGIYSWTLESVHWCVWTAICWCHTVLIAIVRSISENELSSFVLLFQYWIGWSGYFVFSLFHLNEMFYLDYYNVPMEKYTLSAAGGTVWDDLHLGLTFWCNVKCVFLSLPRVSLWMPQHLLFLVLDPVRAAKPFQYPNRDPSLSENQVHSTIHCNSMALSKIILPFNFWR